MKKKWLHNRITGSVLALLLALTLSISPVSTMLTSAEEEEKVTETTDPAVSDETDIPSGETVPTEPSEELPAADLDQEMEPSAAMEAEPRGDETAPEELGEETDTVSTPTALAGEETDDDWESKIKTDVGTEGVVTVYDETDGLADEDALVLMIYGDGFMSSELGTVTPGTGGAADTYTGFYEKAKETAEYIMETSPWNEFKDVVKIYALGTESTQSGARGDSAATQDDYDQDTRDTYFGSHYWSTGMQRLLEIDEKGETRIENLNTKYASHSIDFSVIIVNSSTYGGSGGKYCIASLNSSALDMMLHELGHTVADLADEYWAAGYESDDLPNMDDYADGTVKWERFIGKNGIGIYPYTDNVSQDTYPWYHPSRNCKMQFLGGDDTHPFCEVCKEALRQSFCAKSNVTKLFFQTYADEFYADSFDGDMSEYFIIREGTKETTGDKLGSALTLKYYNATDDVSTANALAAAPTEAGEYKVVATFAGNDTYDACTQTGVYTIEPKVFETLAIESKTYDGTAAELTCELTDAYKDCTVEINYSGYFPRKDQDASYMTDDAYASTNQFGATAPVTPGEYSVEVTVKDGGDNVIATKSLGYYISFKKTKLVNNNDSKYEGAADYYNNQPIVITGEGFTADEQGKFEELAQQYVDYIQEVEPFKELKLYFNFTSVEAISDSNNLDGNYTYFRTSRDTTSNDLTLYTYDGYDWSGRYANNISYYEVSPYYPITIVIVNEQNGQVNFAKDDNFRAYFAGEDEEDMASVADAILNYMTGGKTDPEEQRMSLLKSLYYAISYSYYGVSYTDYCPIITSQAYNTYFEEGEQVDLASYFHTYLNGNELPYAYVYAIDDYKTVEEAYDITYYEVDGDDLTELPEAPSTPGTYFARAELMDVNLCDESYTNFYYVRSARGETTFTITATNERERIKVKDLAEVPEGLKTTYDSVDEIKAELTRVTATKMAASADNMVFYDVKLQICDAGTGVWRDATLADFEERGGITATLPYPDGTGKTTHNFVVSHMFTETSEKLGTIAGEVEFPVVNKTDDGITVVLTGLSPVGVAYEEIPAANPSNPPAKNPANVTKTSAKGSSAKTGDTAPVALYLILAGACALAIVGVVAVRRRKRI